MIWKNQRYHLIYEYIESPILPPPLSLIQYLYNGLKKLKNVLLSDVIIKIEDNIVEFRSKNKKKFLEILCAVKNLTSDSE